MNDRQDLDTRGKIATVTSSRSRAGRPYRRLRRWARHTPNGTMALNMMGVGMALVLVAVLLAVFVA